MPTLLAHGELGAFDEVLLLGIGGAFVVMMVVSWLKSRDLPNDDPEPTSNPSAADTLTPPADTDHVALQ
ncbi:MAG: hypothetical protein SGI73_01800 [Chloroflexota bacterium]|nr:hypothetical protein [Chloroflexota bacterium]